MLSALRELRTLRSARALEKKKKAFDRVAEAARSVEGTPRSGMSDGSLLELGGLRPIAEEAS